MNKDVEILARTIWGESRGEPLEGRVAVANVVMNRARHGGWYGNTPQEVCLKRFQFSCWNSNDPNLQKLETISTEGLHTKDCVSIAALAIAGLLVDNTDGATHYHADYIDPPYWAEGRAPKAKIGHHLFYIVD